MKKIFLTMALCSVALYEPILAAPRSDQLPNDLKKSFPNSATLRAGRLCPQGQYQENRLLITPPRPFAQNNADIPGYLVGAPRPIGNNTGINKWFTQTYYTKELTKDCCRVKRAWIYVEGSHTPNPPPPNHIVGNIITNEAFAELESGNIVNTVVPITPTYPATPSFSGRWFSVNPTNVMTGGMISFAVGDDTNVRRTALYSQSCCLDPIPRVTPRNTASRTGQVQNLIKLMKQDKGTRRVTPSPRITLPPRAQ